MEVAPSTSKRKLSLFDSTCLIVGIIIGAGIYETPSGVAQAATETWHVFLLWALGGLISLCGAVCYAELACCYPQSGGDVVYLSKAYGRLFGFLFGWLQTFVARPGDISLMALVFARYMQVLRNPAATGDPPVWPAVALVVVLTAINICGLHFGKATQNLLTVIKLVGLATIICIACFFPAGPSEPVTGSADRLPRGIAMILVLFTYGGWNEMVYVASEVERPRQNIWRALVLGTVAITVLYLIANAAYLRSLSLPGLAASSAVATDAVRGLVPERGQMLVALVIALSAAGAINGLLLTGARITGAMQIYPAFHWLGQWHPRFQTPVRALLLECAIVVTVVLVAQTFANALVYTSAAVYTFYMATCLSTMVLRRKDPGAERPFRVPLYPLPLILFSGACVMMIIAAIDYRPMATFVCLGILLTGGVFYLLQPQSKSEDAGDLQGR